MGCGCGQQADGATPRERAAICRLCPDALYAGYEAVGCTISGRQIQDHILGLPCPTGRLPGPDGVSEWCGVRWYGVPWPCRAWAWLTARTHPRPGTFPGCGCIVRLKNGWVGFSRVIRTLAVTWRYRLRSF